MNFSDRHVVVTGGTGALGVAVVGALIEAGAVCHVPWHSEDEAENFPHRGHRPPRREWPGRERGPWRDVASGL